MKSALLIFSLVITILLLIFFRGKEIPPSDQIHKIIINYSKDINSVNSKTRKFEITEPNEILKIRNLIGDLRLHIFSNPDTDLMDEKAQWIINIYPMNDNFKYMYVDKNQVMGTKRIESSIYKYLKNNYS